MSISRNPWKTRSNPWETRWKPVVKFEKFVFWPSLEKVRLFLTRVGKPVFYPWKPVKTRPKNMGFWGSWQDAPRRFF